MKNNLTNKKLFVNYDQGVNLPIHHKVILGHGRKVSMRPVKLAAELYRLSVWNSKYSKNKGYID